jgi:endonuclease/exonuclease/phosphatase family metal-dependent hydrolase
VSLLRPARPYLAEIVAAPAACAPEPEPGRPLRIASYNVHRWAGVRGGRAYDPERAYDVLAELDADVVALQEALRPTGKDDPLREAARRLGVHLAFVVTRQHKRGELGNAVLSRVPLAGVNAIDLSFGRFERRAAVAVTLAGHDLTVAATHLALVDRTRARQIRALLDHPQLAAGPAVLLGDMNAWRRTATSRELDEAYAQQHHNAAWPASYPSVRPVLALDRLYARGARVLDIRAHTSAAARRGSDHLPVVATVEVGRDATDFLP